jgi:uncharacterized protein (TIGR02453 family)
MGNYYLSFLQELKQNNCKEWMDNHREWYHQIRRQLIADAKYIIKELTELDTRFKELSPNDCLFRINRDIRFSKNKQPYKENLALYFSLLGKKSFGPGYYLHIEPGNSFFACGCWMPPTNVLNKIRQEIDYNNKQFLSIINNRLFKKYFNTINGDKIKTNPKGFDKENPLIEYLKLKSYIVSYQFNNEQINTGDFLITCKDLIKYAKPFHDFLFVAIADD